MLFIPVHVIYFLIYSFSGSMKIKSTLGVPQTNIIIDIKTVYQILNFV